MPSISKPIIIVGTGRCGSTPFHRILAQHPRLMWMSPLCNKYPDLPALNRMAVLAMDNLLLRLFLGGKLQPGENYRFWDRYAYGFSEPCRDLVGSDVSARVKKQLRWAFGKMLAKKRNRLLLKITGWPRLGFLDEVFEDAKFIHIVRDGRAVASSLLHVDFWRGWHGPQGWRAGLLSLEDQAVWESYGCSFAALAAIEWQIEMRAIETASRALERARLLTVTYEKFCEQPVECFRQVLEFVELPWLASFEREVRSASIKSTSNRWREDLTARQQTIVDEILRDDLRRYGYGDPATAGVAPSQRQLI